MSSAFVVPPINKRTRIPMRTIRALANHIAEKFDPEEIILFGSRETIERRKKLGDWFLIDITEKGKILYERDR